MIYDLHPIRFVKDALKSEDIHFSFSRYKYMPDSLFDEREVFQVIGSDIHDDWLSCMMENLAENEELALHSIFKMKGKYYHIPMIDFSISEWDMDLVLRRLSRFVPKSVLNNMYVYDSGNSYHGYSASILNTKDWLGFLGRLLLVNDKSFNIIDNRWIGHRLIGGYCSLRWTNNTGLYKKIPERIKYP